MITCDRIDAAANPIRHRLFPALPFNGFIVRLVSQLVIASLSVVSRASSASAHERLIVVCATMTLKSLVEVVGGDHVAVTSIVAPAIDAEEFQPKIQDAERLKGAQMLVRVGLDYDLWLGHLLPQLGTSDIRRGGPDYVDASSAIAVLEVRGGLRSVSQMAMRTGMETHIIGWIQGTPRSLLVTFLKHCRASTPAIYVQNRRAFLIQLDEKIGQWEQQMEILQGKLFVAYHNSWAYFARRFRMNIAAFIEPKPGVPPSPIHLAGIIKLMREKAVKIVIREPHEPEHDVAFVAEKAGAKIVVLAASVGEISQVKDYVSSFDFNIGSLTGQVARSLCLIGIHAYFGIEVLRRKVIFVDLALAQIAALGTTIAFMLGHPIQAGATYVYSLGFTLLAAFILSFTRSWSARIPQAALIGVIYVVAAAAAILLLDRAPQGAEHLKQILTGNILTSDTRALAKVAPLYLAIALSHATLRRGLPKTHDNWIGEFAFYASLGIVVTSSVALAGVLLVFSFLIVPACIGVLFANAFLRQLAIGWITGIVASAVGLAGSYAFDLPTGAAIVCAFGLSLVLAGFLYPLVQGSANQMFTNVWRVARWTTSLMLTGSAILLLSLPQADQPLFDALEYFGLAPHTLYFSRLEIAVYKDAEQTAQRYRSESERLNELERQSRAEGAGLDDMQVRRLSSFVRSYAEMRNGEHFVIRELRSRARARARWWAGPLIVMFALAFIPEIFAAPKRLRLFYRVIRSKCQPG
jgi:zinc/manganese transport system permease protein